MYKARSKTGEMKSSFWLTGMLQSICVASEVSSLAASWLKRAKDFRLSSAFAFYVTFWEKNSQYLSKNLIVSGLNIPMN